MRDNEWLKFKLENIWHKYFSDVPRKNKVIIHFGSKARTRLGSIRAQKANNETHTEIRVTSYFKDLRVPEYLIDVTIAHELCHYAHGFFSPLPQLSRYPHKGGIVDKELITRGLGVELKLQQQWLKKNWHDIIDYKPKKIRLRRSRTVRRFNILNMFIK